MDTLKYISSFEIPNAEWEGFQAYCRFQDRGLRKKAFDVLNEFIQLTQTWGLDQKIQFIDWLVFDVLKKTEDEHRVFVYPFVNGFMLQALEQWISAYPNDSRPYQIKGAYLAIDSLTNLYKAFELDGEQNEFILLKIVNCHLDFLWYSTHHMPDYYLSHYADDLEVIQKLYKLLPKFQDQELMRAYQESVEYFHHLIEDWNTWSLEDANQTTEKICFAQWCSDHQRNYEWVKAFDYEKK